jgi:hypothetical protein
MLLGNERLLLVLADRDNYALYLEHLSEMDAAIQRAKAIRSLNRDKIGEDVLFAYDEVKRMLVVCAPAKVCSMSLVGPALLRATRQDATSPVHVRRNLQDASRSGECDQSNSVVWATRYHNFATAFRMWKRRGCNCGFQLAGPDLFICHTTSQVRSRVLISIVSNINY